MPGERKRKHHQRSRSGCITCKQRHMRCDETRPFCRNCLRSGGNCGYSSSTSVPIEDQLKMEQWSPPPSESPLSAGRIDPFYCLESSQCHVSKMLFDHYIHYRILTRTPIRRTVLGGEASALIKSDGAAMHATILLAANHWILLGGNPATVSSALYHHKFEAIRIINERLGDPAKAGLIGTVVAVAAMTVAEATCGSIEVATYHLNGLEQLLKLRGILHTKCITGLIHRMILLADTLTSAATNSRPRFSGMAISESSRRSSTSSSRSTSELTPTSSIRSDHFSSELLNGVDWELAKMFHDLQYLSEQVAANDKEVLAGDSHELMESVCVVEKKIDLLLHDRIESVDTSEHCIEFAAAVLEKGNTTPLGACARAAAIFVYLFLRKIPIHSPVFDWMIDLLQQDFERTEERIRHLYPPELVFWILFVGGIASLGTSKRPWFRSRLVHYRGYLKLYGWNVAKLVLEKLAWLETSSESLGVSLWEEIEGRS